MNQLKFKLVKLFFLLLNDKKKVEKFLWHSNDDKVISCDETNKILNENYTEIKGLLQNAFDDAILMNCSENDFKEKIRNLINSIEFSLGKK